MVKVFKEKKVMKNVLKLTKNLIKKICCMQEHQYFQGIVYVLFGKLEMILKWVKLKKKWKKPKNPPKKHFHH